MFTIEGNVYRRHVHESAFDLADGSAASNDYEASQLLASYIVTLITGGGVATYNRTYNEYKVDMPDGSTEYIRAPRKV